MKKKMEKEVLKEVEYFFYECSNMHEIAFNIMMDALLEIYSKKELLSLVKRGVKKMDNEGLMVLYERIKEEEL